MNTWKEHIEAAEEALEMARKCAVHDGAYIARDVAITHLEIARFLVEHDG